MTDNQYTSIIWIGKGRYTIVDNEDYDFLIQRKWHFYSGYVGSGVHKNTNILMHRHIMNPPKNMVIDHIDGNTFNNQKTNLRICTKAENMRNCKLSKANTSGHKGVYWSKKERKWIASIVINRRKIRLGGFSCIEDAAKAYREAALKYHGEFARL